MASFDLETFLKVQGQTGTGVFEALGMSFGLPSCMLNIASDVLSILPTSILSDVKGEILAGKLKANEVTTEVFKWISLKTGVIEFDTEQGLIKFKSISSAEGMDQDTSQLLANLGGVLGLFQQYASFGAQIYQNYTDIKAQIDAVGDCLDKFKTLKEFQSGNSANQKALLSPQDQEDLIDSSYAGATASLQNAANFINECNKQINSINSVIAERQANPSLEPCFSDSAEFDEVLSGTTLKRCPPEDPGLIGEVFRLVYGPPITQTGQYVLTSDGLYYDSQSGGLDPIFLAISGTVPVGDVWKYDYDPNLGGKGDAISIKSLNTFTENIFDIDLVDDSKIMQSYYDKDHFLATIKQQRDKHVYDLSSNLTEYIITYGADSSIVQNQRQLIISEIANHNNKMDRRKKQIEVAIKAPQMYGGKLVPEFPPGKVPINDFSYLEEYNLVVDLEKQKALIFEQAEVTGMVLPITPKFVKSPPKPPSIGFEHLNVPKIGKGSIIYTPSGAGSGTLLSLTDQIVTDQLFAIYNFLESEVVTPSSTDFKISNCATQNTYNNAKLVAANNKNVFFSGLGIPYLEGIVKNKSSATSAASALGSFVRLPDSSEFRDLTYSPSGFTIECWTHIPNILNASSSWLSATTSSLTKVLFGCDNVGVKEGVSALDHTGAIRDLDYLENKKGDEFVRGFLCGFSRDRRITQASSGFSNLNELNDPASSLSFFLAPTQARDFSSASFINNDECQDYATFYKMKVDLSSFDAAIGNVSSQFVLLDVAFSPDKNKITIFADGSALVTSSMSEVFGVNPNTTPSLPSFKKENSFEYSSTTVDGPTTLYDGPRLNPFYTPWIVGGGYTDGMYKYGNFLGGDRGGIISGLRGHIGSLKFYSKALNNQEVSQNYKAQKGFFKNIKT